MINLLKKCVICLVLLAGAISIAKAESREVVDCQSRLTNNFRESTLMENFKYDSESVRNYGKDYLAESIAILRLFVLDRGCSDRAINFGKGPSGRSASRCRLVERYSPQSRVCYIETNLGYFLVSKSLESSSRLQIIFNLWD